MKSDYWHFLHHPVLQEVRFTDGNYTLYLQIQCMNMHKNILIVRGAREVSKICYDVGNSGVEIASIHQESKQATILQLGKNEEQGYEKSLQCCVWDIEKVTA